MCVCGVCKVLDVVVSSKMPLPCNHTCLMMSIDAVSSNCKSSLHKTRHKQRHKKRHRQESADNERRIYIEQQRRSTYMITTSTFLEKDTEKFINNTIAALYSSSEYCVIARAAAWVGE